MEIGKLIKYSIIAIATATIVVPLAACSQKTENKDNTTIADGDKHKGGPQLGMPGGGPTIDKSGDSVLQAMIKEYVPRFKQEIFHDTVTGKELKYNLFTPDNMNDGRTYPLVLFMADASTPGQDYTTPLTQGYGALVWATDKWQSQHPCYILVPQFSGVGVNDEYQHTDEVDIVIRLVKALAADPAIDDNRLYTTRQSMGGMISMYYNIAYPDVFAASLFVDCHWDTSKFPELVKHKFVYVTAGNSGHSWGNIKPLETAAQNAGIKYEYEQWSAKLPQVRQDALASAMLAKGAPINIINFTPKSVLPADGRGSEHMYSFDYAYRLTPVLEWLFEQSR